MTSVVIVGGGPGGYEAALVAAQFGAEVAIVSESGLGGSAVLTDCVPSKTLIATAEVMTATAESGALGVRVGGHEPNSAGEAISVDMGVVNARIKRLAQAQSADIESGLRAAGVTVIHGRGRLASATQVDVIVDGREQTLPADVVLIATGARPRAVEAAPPDGERILTWEQVYDLPEVPKRLIVVGSGVTGAEFANAFDALGSEVVLVSSRDRVLPGEDADAAQVLEDVFARRGIEVRKHSRAASVQRAENGVRVTLSDGSVVEGSHCLMAVGSIPNTGDLGLESAGVQVNGSGFITVDKVSRTNVPGVYAAGDCTGVLMLASVAAMQGRIAMWHALGDSVHALNLATVSSNIFTTPEIATVGVSQREIDEQNLDAITVMLPLATNARAKMQAVNEGFVKLFASRTSRTVIGGVVVAPKASELIFPITLAVEHRLDVDAVASTFTVYPSLTGSIAEAARRLHAH